MNRQERIDLILDHFEHPRFHGRLDVPGTIVTGGNPGCGDTVTVYMTVTEPGDSVEIAFEGEGCTVSQAAASMVMQMMQGRTLRQIDEATAEPLLEMIGPDIAAARRNCSLLAFNAVKEAGRQLQQQQMTR
ncbi:MAG: iron-sulfur cluster assembly scaffold protein [Anaerolineae bacterium]|nr:iron-sulfur cluster assembly scaffold protein [Anaerolineae bacterium]MCB0244443.1 iron-sulfur cluster assembly scaffold protein [Anaerolineae bacterium]MCB0250110.1 iron-sulfur cluster assembly scaffold protein [Anaerolineae bacterium]